MRRRGLNLRKGLLGLALPALRRLPPRAAARAVAGIGQLEFDLLPGLRRRFRAAVAQARDHFGGDWEVDAVARALAGNQVRWRTRDRLLDGLDDAAFADALGVEGEAAYDAARARGRGVILLGNHFGAHLMPAHWVARRGDPLRLFMERPHHVSRLLRRGFDGDGPLGQRRLFLSRRADPAESAGAILRATRALAAGHVLFLAGDVRWDDAHAAPVRFLGADYRFTTTWVTLAALSGAPVVPTFCRMRPDGGHDLEFLDPWTVPRRAREGDEATPWADRFLAAVAGRVAVAPENSNDYFFWPGAFGAGAAEAEAARPAGRAPAAVPDGRAAA